jgi:hypothetical protein
MDEKQRAEAAEQPSDSDRVASIQKQIEELKHESSKEFGGAESNAPAKSYLDATPLEKANPDKYYRYANIRNPQKATRRFTRDGFKRVSEDEAREAGVTAKAGNLVLAECPREVHEERKRRQKETADARLEAHNVMVTKAAEAIAKELRDKHGLKVPVERLLVKE